jgi:hypothetical protein
VGATGGGLPGAWGRAGGGRPSAVGVGGGRKTVACVGAGGGRRWRTRRPALEGEAATTRCGVESEKRVRE